MVTPRIRSGAPMMVHTSAAGSSSTNNLSLPHAHGGYYYSNSHNNDPDCKTSKALSSSSSLKNLERQMKLYYNRSGIQRYEKEIFFFVTFVVCCAVYLLLLKEPPSPLEAGGAAGNGAGGLNGIFNFFSSGGSKYPWEFQKRPANLFNLPHTMPTSKIYKIPESMTTLGDKSDFYAQLRKAYDTMYPTNPQRSLQAVQDQQKYDIKPFLSMDFVGTTSTTTTKDDKDHASSSSYYDIYNCPEEPPTNYPFHWKIMDILNHWPANDPEPTEHIYQSLCVFDYEKDFYKAMNYRNAELPFIVRGDQEVAKAVERWNTPYYVKSLLGDVNYDTEYSTTNHFLDWAKEGSHPRDWKPPTKRMKMKYNQWLTRADVTDDKLGPDMPHWYLRIAGCREGRSCIPTRSDYIWDELPFYQPNQGSLYVKDTNWQRSVHCRFGMKGVIAETHFDAENNFFTMLGGQRRYILAPPNQCQKMALYEPSHPSARYSKLNWSNPDLETYPEFATAQGSEVVLQAGESLYLPSAWFHHIISLSLNIQCSTRSGLDTSHFQDIEQCGYHVV